MKEATKKTGDESAQIAIDERKDTVSTKGVLKYTPRLGQMLVAYFRHELDNGIYDKLKDSAYVEMLKAKGMNRFFPSPFITGNAESWLATYFPFAGSIQPELHEKGYKEQKVKIESLSVNPDHLSYLLNLPPESSVTNVTQPPQLTRRIVERSTPFVSMNPFVLTMAKPYYRHRFPTAAVLAMRQEQTQRELVDYQGYDPLFLRIMLEKKFPAEDEYKRAENDAKSGFAELLDNLSVNGESVKIADLLESDRSVIETYSNAWNLPSL